MAKESFSMNVTHKSKSVSMLVTPFRDHFHPSIAPTGQIGAFKRPIQRAGIIIFDYVNFFSQNFVFGVEFLFELVVFCVVSHCSDGSSESFKSGARKVKSRRSRWRRITQPFHNYLRIKESPSMWIGHSKRVLLKFI